MVDSDRLYKAIENSGLKLEYICEKLNLTYSGFRNKAQGITEFLASEIYILAGLLDLTEEEVKIIFLSNKGNK